MASNLFSDVYVPPWMVQRESPVDYLLKGEEVGNQMARTLLAARQAELNMAETTAMVGQRMAETELRKQQLEQEKEKSSSWMRHSAELSKWMAHPDRANTPPPSDLDTREELEFVQKVQAADELQKYRTDWNAVRQQQAENAITKAELANQRDAGLSKRIESWENARDILDEDTFALLEDLPNAGRLQNGMPSPAARRIINQWRIDNKKPPVGEKFEQMKSTDLEPVTKTLPDGTVLAWMPGATTLHVINQGKKVELTPAQALKLSQNYKFSPEDRDLFSQYAASKGKEMTGGFKATEQPKKPAEPEAPGLLDRIKSWFSKKPDKEVTPPSTPQPARKEASKTSDNESFTPPDFEAWAREKGYLK